jgi:hypothetical protein
MPCRELDQNIAGNKEGGVALLESVAELASDLPHYGAPMAAKFQ